jgi:DNA processing protein
MSELAAAAFLGAPGAAGPVQPRGERFRAFARGFDERRFRAELEGRSLRWLGRSDPGFPRSLAAIFDPPPGLFVRGSGRNRVLDLPAVAIVGARACSSYGSHVARMLGRELAAAGLLVVSGLARGVDAAAHRGALEAGGVTVAVLGCGIDRDYPATHASLSRQIEESGLVVSEYPPGVEPSPWRFPARNRIVAGLAAATIVVEARRRSGALITADFALEEGREVLAVPGEITSSLSEGTNDLLRNGSTLITSAEDVLHLFGIEKPALAALDLGPEAEAVIEALAAGPASADDLARRTALTAAELGAALVELELAGAISEGEGVYRRVT